MGDVLKLTKNVIKGLAAGRAKRQGEGCAHPVNYSENDLDASGDKSNDRALG